MRSFVKGRVGLRKVFRSLLDDLPDEHAEALRACSVFSGLIDPCALSSVIGCQSASLLDALAARGLIERIGERFRLSSGLREFLLTGSLQKSSKLRDLHAAHFVQVASQLSSNPSGPQVEAYVEHLDDLNGAFGWSIVRGQPDKIFQLADSLYDFWLLVGWYEEGAAWLVEAAHSAASEPQVAARLYNFAGSLFVLAGLLDAANEQLRKALSLATALKSEPLLARIYNNFGTSAWVGGNLPNAAIAFEEAYTVADTIGAEVGAQLARCNAAGVLGEMGKFAKSMALLKPLVQIADPGVKGFALMNSGMNRYAQAEADFGLSDLTEAFEVLHGAGILRGLSYCTRCLVPSYAANGLQTQAAFMSGLHDQLNEEHFSVSSPESHRRFDEARSDIEESLGPATFLEIYEKGYYAQLDDVKSYLSKKW
ncbi:MAG: hypothetical protein ABL949_14040 [Fimbriimonadaceae bacterium]